ncbi:hypothetical protein N7491_004320 [Penicillium cf. griseofulvum]|uniref:Uncharacterized protein n=1 Tax=Penicillium cf. griseofulvum TaxID=2972120 RepID=A0A9W9J128_9EURO|nr:hypothetical protein N7472_007012 [Penicillium cf. griseofulvum]KAJ5423055.1 hypothetical protein N7445_011163 [Penicillium cf. griseofulvum]KAJ5433725.1 hypothetical protein N7491_004320 [Penicillium cf. griseofulvum]
MSTPDADTNRAESNDTSNPGPSIESISGIRESTHNHADNTRVDATQRTEIYTDNTGHVSRLTDEERQRLEELATDSSGGAIFVTYDLVHRIDTLMADGTRRTDEALMQYLFQDDIWEAVDTGDTNDTGTRRENRDGNSNGRQDESELKLPNGTGESHEEELK